MELGTILTLASIAVAIIGIPWYLGWRIARIQNAYENFTKVSNGMLGLLGILISSLHKREALDDKEFSDILKSYGEMAQVPTKVGTPLTAEEINRFNSYLDKVHKGEGFLVDEVEDYNYLVEQLKTAKKNDPSVWPFVALGAFLLGLFVASKSK